MTKEKEFFDGLLVTKQSIKENIEKPTADMVNHPNHYKVGGIEVIDYIQAKLSPEGYAGYLEGNILKYVSRYKYKNGVEDLKKAQVYLTHLITLRGNI